MDVVLRELRALQNRMFGWLNSIYQRVVMFNLNTRNHENMVLAESAESNLKVDPTLRELSGLCAKPF
ncbi:MAG: hypothetical protein A2096_16135 [Spirochaetes bacterium GWF1_41_5]|nr:MAG: hypothetical protein A2096_16135 [Spirochaetes bacterium GWF1_41_5]